MRTRLIKNLLVVMFAFLLAHYAYSEIEWNPSLSETQKTAFLKKLEVEQAKLREKRPVYTVISIMNSGVPLTPKCWVGLFGNTNVVAYKPLLSQAFDAQLFDADGKQIAKTSYGAQFGERLDPDKKLLDGTFRKDADEMFGHSRMLNFDKGGGEGHYWDFDVMKSFNIKEAGEYRLQVQARLFVKDTNGVFQPFILPPVETSVKVLKSNLP